VAGIPATDTPHLAIALIVLTSFLVLILLALLALLITSRLLAAHATLAILVILTALLALLVLPGLLTTRAALTISILLVVLHMKLLLHHGWDSLPWWSNIGFELRFHECDRSPQT
jgi:hypothetical protein